MLTMAMAKGRLADKTLEILKNCGVDVSVIDEKSRKLIHTDEKSGISFLMVKPVDVPTYVHYGIADLGVVGKDTLLEHGLDLYEMINLKFGACRMCVAGFSEKKQKITGSVLKVATKYPNVAKKYYDKKGETIEIIKLNGSIEIAPLLGLSDVIVDIVESGRTLVENGLCVLEEIAPISARLVVNPVRLKTKAEEIMPLIAKMKSELEK